MISSDRVPEPADATHHDPALPGLRPRSGGPELAHALEAGGYASVIAEAA